ncbi:hypothetical protein [Rhodococcus sp. NPDC049939]|uniref:hypothetical protein n=1 Tax=Rhodococcus sp. NPDC049939 TaxID=3155511 RepID=UPI0033DE840E
MTTDFARMRRNVHSNDTIRTVDIAGTDWPLYKLEALGVALMTFAIVLVVTQTLQTAVLTAAAIAVVVWWARRYYSRHATAESSHGQAARPQ